MARLLDRKPSEFRYFSPLNFCFISRPWDLLSGSSFVFLQKSVFGLRRTCLKLPTVRGLRKIGGAPLSRHASVGDALPPLSTAMAATPGRTYRTLESDHLHAGTTKQGDAARSAAERRQITESRGASLDSVVNSSWAPVLCPHGDQEHTRCMLDRAFRLACGHADPQSCVACRFEWPARNRPLHPAELAEDLLRPRPGVRWSVVAGALQFAAHLEEGGPRLESASYATTVAPTILLRKW